MIFFIIVVRMFIAIIKRIFHVIVERESHKNKGMMQEVRSHFYLKPVFTHYTN